MVAHSFARSYENLAGIQNFITYNIFYWLHGVLVVYISFEYLISVIENYSKITGKNTNKLLMFLNKKLDQFLGAADAATSSVMVGIPEEQEPIVEEIIADTLDDTEDNHVI